VSDPLNITKTLATLAIGALIVLIMVLFANLVVYDVDTSKEKAYTIEMDIEMDSIKFVEQGRFIGRMGTLYYMVEEFKKVSNDTLEVDMKRLLFLEDSIANIYKKGDKEIR
jgi:hypothetical protein